MNDQKSEAGNRIDDYWYSGETFEMMSDDEFQIEQILTLFSKVIFIYLQKQNYYYV